MWINAASGGPRDGGHVKKLSTASWVTSMIAAGVLLGGCAQSTGVTPSVEQGGTTAPSTAVAPAADNGQQLPPGLGPESITKSETLTAMYSAEDIDGMAKAAKNFIETVDGESFAEFRKGSYEFQESDLELIREKLAPLMDDKSFSEAEELFRSQGQTRIPFSSRMDGKTTTLRDKHSGMTCNISDAPWQFSYPGARLDTLEAFPNNFNASLSYTVNIPCLEGGKMEVRADQYFLTFKRAQNGDPWKLSSWNHGMIAQNYRP
jgi:hypothetical protein